MMIILTRLASRLTIKYFSAEAFIGVTISI
jgi:hypothetical protein